MNQGRIIVITGAPGTGKTTTASAVAKESDLEKSVHMHTDDFYHYLSKGAIPPHLPESNEQNLIVIEAFLEAAKRYARGGYDVIVQAARDAGVGTTTIYRWSARYEAEGAAGFLPYQKNRVYPPELKLKAVLEYLSGAGSLEEISKKYKLRNDRQLSNWIKVYNAHGDFNSTKFSGGGSYMKQGRETTFEERVQIARECIATGKNYGEIALKYQVSYQRVRTWTLRFEQMGEAGLQDRRGQRKKDQTPRTELEQAQIEIEQLKHKLYLAEMENALLKKLDEVERRNAFQK